MHGYGLDDYYIEGALHHVNMAGLQCQEIIQGCYALLQGLLKMKLSSGKVQAWE
jgi:hypothetical protein